MSILWCCHQCLAIAIVRPVHLMNGESVQIFRQPSDQARRLGLLSVHWLLPFTPTVAIYCYYSARKHCTVPRRLDRWARGKPRHCSKGVQLVSIVINSFLGWHSILLGSLTQQLGILALGQCDLCNAVVLTCRWCVSEWRWRRQKSPMVPHHQLGRRLREKNWGNFYLVTPLTF